MAFENSLSYLELSSNPLEFDAVSKARLNNVFYDDSNNQLFTVKSGEMTEVTVKEVVEQSSRTFKVKEKGPVICIKFSPSQNILALQRTFSSVEFINFKDVNQDGSEYSQSCKMKKADLIGFIWVHNNEILFITNLSVELYRVDAEKRSFQLLKIIQMNINWSVYCPHTSILLLSTNPMGSSLQVLQLEQANIIKLKKIDNELPTPPKGSKLSLQERDITICKIYNKPRILVLRHSPQIAQTSNSSSFSFGTFISGESASKSNSSVPAGTSPTSVIVFTVISPVSIKKTNVLNLDQSGRFAVNILDNLILVHHQASMTTSTFDIGLETEYDGTIWYHKPILKPFTIHTTMTECELYSPNWLMFQPNVIIDAKIGCLWHLNINLDRVINLVSDKCQLIDFLMLRSNSKLFITKVINDLIWNKGKSFNNSMDLLGKIFNKMNIVFRRSLEIKMISQMASPVTNQESALQAMIPPFTEIVPDNYVDQLDMYLNIFSKMAEEHSGNQSNSLNGREMIYILLEYFRSLSDFQIPIDNSLQVLIINLLVRQKAYYQLHQLLQYHVVSDSKQLACLLLSLENFYPPAHQLAIDMLQRLPDAKEEITEVLLSKQQILPALRFLVDVGIEKSCRDSNARKFLQLANGMNNISLYSSVVNFFESRKES